MKTRGWALAAMWMSWGCSAEFPAPAVAVDAQVNDAAVDLDARPPADRGPNPDAMADAELVAPRDATPDDADVDDAQTPPVDARPECAAELCNGLDDDCDGQTDEDFQIGEHCVSGIGPCAVEGQRECDLGGGARCDAVALPPSAEQCDTLDNDCDGAVDEGFNLGAACTSQLNACVTNGVFVCQDDGEAGCSAPPIEVGEEQCDGVDNDCNGIIDDGQVCGTWVAGHCRIWLGWSDDVDAAAPVPAWGACPAQDRDTADHSSCVSSRADGRFHALAVPNVDTAELGDDDWLGLAFECDPEGVGDWVERHCGVALAYGDDVDREDFERLTPTGCSTWSDGTNDDPRCVKTGGDGLFHALQLRDDVDDHHDFSFALYCADPADAARSAAVASSVQAFFTLRERTKGGGNCDPEWTDRADWDDCPDRLLDNRDDNRCLGRPGGGDFSVTVSPEKAVNRCDQFGVALLPVRP